MTIPTPNPPHKLKHAGGVSTIERSSETMRITGPDGQSVWLQNGLIYNDAGEAMPDVPGWFEAEFAKLTKKMQQAHSPGDLPEPIDEAEAEVKDLNSMTKAKLTKVAEMESVAINSGDSRAVIINKILAHREQQ